MEEANPPEIWVKEIERLKRRVSKLEEQENLVVFYGSSTIRLWVHMAEDLAPYQTLNLGFGGSTYAWCLEFFEDLFQAVTPSHVVLYCGDNDLGQETEIEEILSNIDLLIEKITGKYGVLPISLVSVKPSLHRADLTEKINKLNTSILARAEREDNLHFVDFYHALAKEGPSPDLFLSDGLHLNREGYEILRSTIKNHLDTL